MRQLSLIVALAMLMVGGIVAQSVSAQDGTPAPETPEPTAPGQMTVPLAIGLFESVPDAPVAFYLSLATFPPGASTPPEPDPGPSMTYVQSGQLRFEIEGPATVTRLDVGPQPATGEVTVGAGDWVVVPMGVPFRVLNEGSEYAVALVAGLLPLETVTGATPSAEEATPIASPEGTPSALASPEGTTPEFIFEPLAGGVIAELPPAPLAVALLRLTYDPGAGDPIPSQNAGPLIGYVENGQIGYTLASGQATTGKAGSLEFTEAPVGQEVILNPGDWLFEQAGAASQGRNTDGAGASVLLAILAPPDAFLIPQPTTDPAASPVAG